MERPLAPAGRDAERGGFDWSLAQTLGHAGTLELAERWGWATRARAGADPCGPRTGAAGSGPSHGDRSSSDLALASPAAHRPRWLGGSAGPPLASAHPEHGAAHPAGGSAGRGRRTTTPPVCGALVLGSAAAAACLGDRPPLAAPAHGPAAVVCTQTRADHRCTGPGISQPGDPGTPAAGRHRSRSAGPSRSTAQRRYRAPFGPALRPFQWLGPLLPRLRGLPG